MATKYIAKWGAMVFSVTPDKIVPFEDLSTSYSLKSESNTDTSGTASTNTRGREAQTITFKTSYMTATGTNPKTIMNSWYKLIGAAYALYIGGKRFGPRLLQLEKVDWSNFQYAPNGTIIAVDAAITLVEYSGATSKVSSKAAVQTADGTIKRSKSSIAADTALNKAAALAAKPSSTDKAKKKNSSSKKK